MKHKWNPEFEDTKKYERVTGPIGRDEEGNHVRKLSLLDGRYVLKPPLEQDKRNKDNQIVYPPPIGRVNILEAIRCTLRGDGIIEVLMPDDRVSFYREKKRVNKMWGGDRGEGWGERAERWRTALKLLTKTSFSPAPSNFQKE